MVQIILREICTGDVPGIHFLFTVCRGNLIGALIPNQADACFSCTQMRHAAF